MQGVIGEDVEELVRRGWQRIMYLKTYVDDSGSDPASEIYVLGGVCLPESWWKEEVCPAWSGVLSSTPSVGYFKASEVWEKDIGKGTPWVGLEPHQRRRKVNALVDVLTTYHPLTMSFHLEWQVWKEFEKAHALAPGKDDPYFFLFYAAIILQAKWGIREANPTPVNFVFDNQGHVGEEVRAWYPRFKGRCAQDIQSRLGELPEFGDEKVIIPLQCADLVAWYARRNALAALRDDWHRNVWTLLTKNYSIGTIDMEDLIDTSRLVGIIEP